MATARLVGLEPQRDDVAHQPHVLAYVFGQAIVGPCHFQGRSAAAARAVVGLLFGGSHRRGPLLDLANASEILVELGPVVLADLAAQVGGLLPHAVENALIVRLLPRLSNRLSNASDG